jgi:hypothetical protein
MAEFIKIEPSTDVHLVKDANFKDINGTSLNQLNLKIWAANPTNLANPADPTDRTRGYLYSEVTSACQFDFFPIGQNIVTLNGTSLVPSNKGVAFMQIRFHDASEYHYLIVRISVHNTFEGWWFGNDKFSVFRDDVFAHGQPSIYALFENDEVGDITGHNYVTLTSNDPSKIEIANVATKPYRGRIRGVAVGDGSITGRTPAKQRSLNVKILEFAVNNNPILKRVQVDQTLAPKQKHNMLFIGEGFTDETKFNEVVSRTTHDLFDLDRHQPYKLLKDDINVWSAFQKSEEEGITSGALITAKGLSFPEFDASDADEEEVLDSAAPGGKKKVYTAKKLTELVGVSDKGLIERGVTNQNYNTQTQAIAEALKTAWRADPVITSLGFKASKIHNNQQIINWVLQTPMGLLPQAKDSYYGFIAGNRPGDLVSKTADISAEITSASPSADFVRRMREWYIPNDSNKNFPPTVDPRKWAPDIYHYENNIYSRWVSYFLRKHISQFNEQQQPAIDTAFNVGRCWADDFSPAIDSNPHEVRSAGLVCFLINTVMQGRSANNTGFFIGAIIGRLDGYIDFNHIEDSPPIFNIAIDLIEKTRKLNLTPQISINYNSLIGMVAHEFGHSFKLGDEYEEFKQNAESNEIEDSDNLVHLDHILGTVTPNFPTPIDPEKIKWAVLHRIKQSIKITETATFADPDSIALKVSASDIDKLNTIKTQGEKVFIRKLIVNFTSQDNKQLRFSANDILTKDIFSNLEIISIDAANKEVKLKVTANSVPAHFPISGTEDVKVPAGSVIYVPKKASDGSLLFLVEKKVMEFMKTQKYNANVPAGRALSENFDETNSDPDPEIRLDEVSDNKDSPPSISGFKGPCKDYKVIGAYEGGGTFVGKAYRPSGACKMRDDGRQDDEGAFCFVCKYLIVSRVNASKLDALEAQYPGARRS